MASQDRADVYARITAEIVAAIEAGAGDYHMPWHHDGAATARPVNVASGKTYRGVNVLALWVAAHSAGYPTGVWGTYRQWQELGARVRKGERTKFEQLRQTAGLRPASSGAASPPQRAVSGWNTHQP